jgi:hypothetical protein
VRLACEVRKRTPYARFSASSDDQLLDVGHPHAHRLQVAFTSAQRAAIAEQAARAGLSLSATVRQLVAAALSLDGEPGLRGDSQAALAALVAAEHAVLAVASVLPDGERRIAELAPQAAAAAEQRLAMFREVEP